MFALEKISNEGAHNPIVSRIGFGLSEIIDMTKLPNEIKLEIKEGCYEIMKDLLEAEKAARPLIQELRDIESKLVKGEIKVIEHNVIHVPQIEHLENSRIFLKFAKQALQRFAKILGPLIGKEFTKPHFDKILNQVRTRFGEKHIVTTLLKADQTWLKELNSLRNEDEHPKGKVFVTGFKVESLAKGKIHISPPCFFNKSPVLSRLETYSHNLLTFIEEILVFTLAESLPPIVSICEIPEEQRDPSAPVRFRLGLTYKIEGGK